MPFTVELKDASRTITVEADKSASIFEERIQRFASAIEVLNKAIPLTSFLGQQVAGQPFVYTYSFTAKDGRTWSQVLDFTNGVRMTFNVPQGWRLEEFVPHRAVRDEFILLVRDLDLIKAEALYV